MLVGCCGVNILLHISKDYQSQLTVTDQDAEEVKLVQIQEV